MKTRETFPGKTYSVHTMKGCTIIAPDGWQKTIEAPDGYFDAHFGSVVIDGDDEASIKELFKLAPQQRLTLLGVLGGDQLPAGYTRLAYLEGSGTQFIPTSHQVHYNDSMEVRCSILPPRNNAQNVFVPIDARKTDDGYYIMQFNVQTTQTLDANISWGTRTNPIFTIIKALPYEKNRTYLCRMQKGKFYFDEVPYDIKVTSEPLENPQFKIFASVSASYYSAGRVMRANLYRNNEIIANLIPALDQSGSTCVFDTVTGKTFYNSGSGQFIAGVENQAQLNNMLRKLPDRTGLEVGTLQVRLADELQTPENEQQLDAMLAKNWEISQAA